MTESNIAFAGSIPERYERFLVPALFEEYADDLAARIPQGVKRVLELACGTGVVTRRLRASLPKETLLTATDLADAMVAFASAKLPPSRALEYRQADATALPFADATYDAVVCQFGVMFFPDKAVAFREARRVLLPGGTFLFNVWDDLEHNPVSRVAQETIVSLYPSDPPQFYRIPFGFHDAQAIRSLLDRTGFTTVSIHVLSFRSRSPSARDYAAGLVTGTPMVTAIEERKTPPLEEVSAKVTTALERSFGTGPIDQPMRALVVTATAV